MVLALALILASRLVHVGRVHRDRAQVELASLGRTGVGGGGSGRRGRVVLLGQKLGGGLVVLGDGEVLLVDGGELAGGGGLGVELALDVGGQAGQPLGVGVNVHRGDDPGAAQVGQDGLALEDRLGQDVREVGIVAGHDQGGALGAFGGLGLGLGLAGAWLLGRGVETAHFFVLHHVIAFIVLGLDESLRLDLAGAGARGGRTFLGGAGTLLDAGAGAGGGRGRRLLAAAGRGGPGIAVLIAGILALGLGRGPGFQAQLALDLAVADLESDGVS